MIIEDKKEDLREPFKEQKVIYMDSAIQCEFEHDYHELLKNEEILNDSRMCIIWFKQNKDAVLIPCGHTHCCFKCLTDMKGKNINNCPICQNPFINFIKIFGQN